MDAASDSRSPYDDEPAFEPSAATAAHFLCAQGSDVLVLDHDSLALQRKFCEHNDTLQLMSVDNVSERNSGRWVVTYDKSMTSIIWDLYSGKQLASFASYDPLLAASWMRNGSVAFGNTKGEVITFDPSASEHVSVKTIGEAITALAPAADCKTYAIGYRDGTIFIANLQPRFIVIHTLTTNSAPCPVSQLCWHASSTKQKSDMLAVQNDEGDLRVWSICKPAASGPPRYIRILKREARFRPGRTFICWAKNGRVLQFAENETWAWDVRTKNVTFMPVQTVDHVRGIAAHGPTAAMFTLGPDHTVQQYDTESGRMIRNVHHKPAIIIPTPPIGYHLPTSESGTDNDTASEQSSIQYDYDRRRYNNDTPASTRHSRKASSEARRAAHKYNKIPVVDMISPSRTEQTTTTISVGTYNGGHGQSTPVQIPPPRTASAMSRTSVRKASKLRHQVVMSPLSREDHNWGDLFPATRGRLSEARPSQIRILDEKRASSDELRCQMLSVIFGWDHDIRPLIEYEITQTDPDSVNAALLTRWLYDEPAAMAQAIGQSDADSAVDWMRFAIGMLSNRHESKGLAQIFVERMLSKGEIHMAVIVLLATGDKNGAIEVYVTRNCFLEAILLTCLLMPGDWHRQSHLVRKWGEHVVQNSQQQLAIRCFSCTGVEAAEPWTSPTAQIFNKLTGPISDMLQQTPQFEPPRPTSQPQPSKAAAAAAPDRMTNQKGGLRLITSFQKPGHLAPGLRSENSTPINNASVTPIIDSAFPRSALPLNGPDSYRATNIRSLNEAFSRDNRHRLSSIGETPVDVDPPSLSYDARTRSKSSSTSQAAITDRNGLKIDTGAGTSSKGSREESNLLSAARYDPSVTPVQSSYTQYEPQTAVRPTQRTFSRQGSTSSAADEQASYASTSSHKSRKPEGLSLKVLSGPNHRGGRNQTQYDDPIFRPGTTETERTMFSTTPLSVIDPMRVLSPSVSGRSVDQYISSLEQAQYYERSTRSRNSNRPREGKEGRMRSSTRDKQHHKHETNGRRSPSSPVPMSPNNKSTRLYSVGSVDSMYSSAQDQMSSTTRRSKRDSGSTAGRRRDRSRSGRSDGRRRTSVNHRSGREPPTTDEDRNRRGRSQSRKASSRARSPSSPLPMVPSEEDLNNRSSIEPNASALKLVSRDRSRLRSTSRRPVGNGTKRYESRERINGEQRPPSRQAEASYRSRRASNGSRGFSTQETTDDDRPDQVSRTLQRLDAVADSIRSEQDGRRSDIVDRKREIAQAELEARRLSLAQRTSASPVHPTAHAKMNAEGASQQPSLHRQLSESILQSTTYNRPKYESGTSFSIDRSTTPQAMQRPVESQPVVFEERYEPQATAVRSEPETEPIDTSTFLLPARTYTPMGTRIVTNSNTLSNTMPRGPSNNPVVNGFRAPSPKLTIREEPEIDEPLVVGSPVASEDEAISYRISTIDSEGPAIMPELQHLLVPPPPPPPPSGPPLLLQTSHRALSLNTSAPPVQMIDTPQSAFQAETPKVDWPGSNGSTHRRGKSTEERNPFSGKLKGITERLRPASRSRDNASRVPADDNHHVSPYETHLGLTSAPPLGAVREE